MARARRLRLHDRILDLARRQPDRSSYSIACELGTTTATVVRVREGAGSGPPADAGEALAQGAWPAPVCRCDRPMPGDDAR